MELCANSALSQADTLLMAASGGVIAGQAMGTDPVIVTTDASSLGWGAHAGGSYIQGSWTREQACSSSSFRELSGEQASAASALPADPSASPHLDSFRPLPPP